jgi:hypothetical protein
MQQRLPRWSRIFAAQRPAHRAGPPTVALDDPWAGEDDDWDLEDVAAEAPEDFARFFRGLAFGLLVGVALWALAVVGLVLLLG